MHGKSTLVSSVIGVGLFISDLKFGWLSGLLGGIPSIIVIAFVSGIISGDLSGGSVSGLVSGVGGVTASILLAPVLFPEWGVPPPDIFGRVMWALGSSIAQSSYAVIEGLAAMLAALGAILSILVTVVLFGMSWVAGILGGLIGRILRGFSRKGE